MPNVLNLSVQNGEQVVLLATKVGDSLNEFAQYFLALGAEPCDQDYGVALLSLAMGNFCFPVPFATSPSGSVSALLPTLPLSEYCQATPLA